MGPVSSIRTPFGGSFLRYRNQRQREQEKTAWEMSRPERQAAERERRAWIIENDPHFAKISVRGRRGMVAR